MTKQNSRQKKYSWLYNAIHMQAGMQEISFRPILHIKIMVYYASFVHID